MSSFLIFLCKYFVLLNLEVRLLLLITEIFKFQFQLSHHEREKCAFRCYFVDAVDLLLGDVKLLQEGNNLQFYLEKDLLIFNLEQILQSLHFLIWKLLQTLHFLFELLWVQITLETIDQILAFACQLPDFEFLGFVLFSENLYGPCRLSF